MTLTAATAVLAQERLQDTGPIGLVIVVAIGIATVLLIRNMNARLKRLPREFPPPDQAPGPEVEPPDRTS